MNQSNSHSKFSFLRSWIVWFFPALFYLYEYFLQVSPSVMVPDLMQAFKVDASTLGNLAAFYFYSYALMQIPAGSLVDRFGPRKLLTAMTATCAGGVFIFGVAQGLGLAEFGRTLIGFGSAFALLGTLKLCSTWFPPERFAFLTGLSVTMGMMGGIIGEAPLAYLVESMGWRQSLMVLAMVGAALTVIIWIIVRDEPTEKIKAALRTSTTDVDAKHQTQSIREMIEGLAYVFKSKDSWLAAIYGGLIYAPTSAFGALWGVPFIEEAYQVPRHSAAGLVSIVFLGWAVGSPVGGWVSDTIGRRRPPMIAAALGGLVTLLCIIYIPHLPLWLLGTLLFVFGFFSSGFLPAFSVVKEINPPKTSGTALGFTNAINMVGGAAAQPFIGYLLDLNWHGSLVNGARQYSVGSFHIAFLAMPISLALALAILPFIKETYCKPAYQHDSNNT